MSKSKANGTPCLGASDAPEVGDGIVREYLAMIGKVFAMPPSSRSMGELNYSTVSREVVCSSVGFHLYNSLDCRAEMYDDGT